MPDHIVIIVIAAIVIHVNRWRSYNGEVSGIKTGSRRIVIMQRICVTVFTLPSHAAAMTTPALLDTISRIDVIASSRNITISATR